MISNRALNKQQKSIKLKHNFILYLQLFDQSLKSIIFLRKDYHYMFIQFFSHMFTALLHTFFLYL